MKSGWLGLVAGLGLACGCGKSVPAPWNEMGVPSEHLVEVHAATSSQRFSGVYDQDPRAVVLAFQEGLKKGRFVSCGRVVVDESGGGRSAFFRKEAVLWELALVDNHPRTLTTFEPHASRGTGVWAGRLPTSGCVDAEATAITETSSAPVTSASVAEVAKPNVDAGPTLHAAPRDGGAAPSKPAMRQGAPQVSGHIAPEAIQRVVRRNFGRMRLCYENGLRSAPNLEGHVNVKFVIDRAGAVTSASDNGSDLPSPPVIDCVVRAFKGLTFPAPEGDGTVSGVYPFTFRSGT